jgi:hypothetical protein
MRVEATKQAASGQTGRTPRDATLAPAPAEHDTDSRALVVVAPPAAHQPPASHSQAAFLAHLIAVKDQFPQTRERRRAEPGEAAAAYRAVAAMTARR